MIFTPSIEPSMRVMVWVMWVSSSSTIAAGILVGRPASISEVRNMRQNSGAMIMQKRKSGRCEYIFSSLLPIMASLLIVLLMMFMMIVVYLLLFFGASQVAEDDFLNTADMPDMMLLTGCNG